MNRPTTQETGRQQAGSGRVGLLGGLLDVRFRRMVTPRLVGCLYMAAATCVASGCLAGVLLIWGMASWLGAGWWIFAPFVLAAGVVAVLAVRVICEWVLMAFTRGRPLTPPSQPMPRQRLADGRWQMDNRSEGNRP